MRLRGSKKWFALFGLLVVLVAATGCPEGTADLPEGAVAQVGETVITRADLDQRIAEIQDQLGEQVPTEEDNPEAFEVFEQQVLDYMVTVEVVKQKAEEMGIEVTETEVEEQVEQIKSMFGGDEQAFEEAIAEQNLTPEKLRENLTEQALITKVIEEVTADVEVSDEEIASKYEEDPEHYKVGESRKTRHILISPEGMDSGSGEEISEEQWEAARQEADQIREEITGGGDFAELAKEHSDDPGSAEQGGDLGNITPGSMVPEFDEKVFSLEEGAVSEPVRTQFGWHIIQVLEINPERTLELDEVSDGIRAELLDQKKREAWEQWLAEAKEDLNVVIAEGLEYVTTTTTVPEAESGEGDASDDGVTETTEASEDN
ncbi:MAG: peptidylprolyl isomerase [Thermoleophilia bacterium]